MPTLVVYARDDQVVPAHMSIDLAARIAGAQTAELAAGGHFAPLIAPEDCAETMIGFVGAA